MTRFLLTFILFCLFYSRSISQIITQSREQQSSIATDTALFNRYLGEAARLSDLHPDSSHYYLQKAYTLALNTHDSKGLAAYYHFLTARYNEHSHYDSAMQTAKAELHWARDAKDSISLAWAYNAIANVFEYKGDMDSSANYFIRALRISDALNAEKLSGTLNYNLASVFYLIGDYKRALVYARIGYQTGRKLNDTHMMSNSLLDMGSIETGLKNYDTALAYFNRVISMVRHTPDSLTILNALNDEGDVYAKRKQYRKSLSKYREMLQLAQQHQDPYNLLYAYGNLGVTQLQTKQLQKAEINLTEAIGIGKRIDAKNELRLFYESLSEVKEGLKQFSGALYYRKKYDSLNDTLMSEATRKNMHLLEVKYNTAQKDKQIAQQKLDISQKQTDIERKNTWILIFLGSILALSAILLLSIRSYRHKRNLHRQNLLTLQKQHEVNTLKTKMEAREEERSRIGREMHDDVGSALTTILYLSDDLKTQDKDKHKQTADRISSTAGSVVDKMNEIIWSMNREYDTLDDLIAYSRQYVVEFLEDHDLSYHFNMPDPVPSLHLPGVQRRNIYLVIKEILHNIIKHADATVVNIDFQLNEKLTVTIHDNGKGIDREKLRRFGNGLRNMEQRMTSVGGSFDIKSNNGTTIRLQCPIGNENEV